VNAPGVGHKGRGESNKRAPQKPLRQIVLVFRKPSVQIIVREKPAATSTISVPLQISSRAGQASTLSIKAQVHLQAGSLTAVGWFDAGLGQH
jgi:hypothetical protein